MITLEVDGRTIEANEGETILAALKRSGVHVPTLCHMEGLPPSGACRLCVVELEGAPNLVPSCSFPVAAGMKIKSKTPKVTEAHRTIVELLLSSHPDDCLYCTRSGKCDLQSLAQELGIRQRLYRSKRTAKAKDVSNPSIIRDPDKCILCGRCVRVCEEVQGVAAIDFVNRGCKTFVGTAFNGGLNLSSCINCGQCILVCPTAALTEHKYVDDVLRALADPDKVVVVQHAPAVSVTIAEEFGFKPGTDFDGKMVAALRRVGFDRVFDTSFSADLTVMEEASELVERLKTGGPIPLMSSCSPGWVKFVEQFYPEMLGNLSTCKSPQQMLGAIIKHYYAQREGIDPARVFSVSIMPCTAKKFEAGRPEMMHEAVADVDAVLTTRELAQMIRMHGIDLTALPPEGADTPFGDRSTAGKLFGATGGVAEAAIRTAHYLVTGQELSDLKVQAVRGLKGVKEARVKVGDLELGVAVVSGLSNARRVLDELRKGRKDLHFIEVMTCPGGCIAGGGQPIGTNPEAVRARMQALYAIDRDGTVRVSHKNPSIQRLYREFLGAPLGHKSHELLHTHYTRREVLV